MEEEFNEAKNFKNQMKFCSILCWLAVAFFTYKVPNKFDDWVIVPIAAVIFTIIYFKINNQLKQFKN